MISPCSISAVGTSDRSNWNTREEERGGGRDFSELSQQVIVTPERTTYAQFSNRKSNTSSRSLSRKHAKQSSTRKRELRSPRVGVPTRQAHAVEPSMTPVDSPTSNKGSPDIQKKPDHPPICTAPQESHRYSKQDNKQGSEGDTRKDTDEKHKKQGRERSTLRRAQAVRWGTINSQERSYTQVPKTTKKSAHDA